MRSWGIFRSRRLDSAPWEGGPPCRTGNRFRLQVSGSGPIDVAATMKQGDARRFVPVERPATCGTGPVTRTGGRVGLRVRRLLLGLGGSRLRWMMPSTESVAYFLRDTAPFSPIDTYIENHALLVLSMG